MLGILLVVHMMVVDRSQRANRAVCPRRPLQRRFPMIAYGIGVLALFSVLSILLGSEDPRRPDPRDDIRLWMPFGIR